jgi:uncharacterized protein YaaN involved in tellurite resistance
MAFKPIQVNQVSKPSFTPVSPTQLVKTGASNTRVVQLLSTFDSPTGILEYGADVMQDIAAKSDALLLEVKDADVDFVEQQLTSILTMAKSFHLNTNQKSEHGIGKLLGKFKFHFIDTKEQLAAEFNDISSQMDRVVGEIDNATHRIVKKLDGLQVQYKENLAEYKRLELLIQDAEEAYQIKQNEVEKLQNSATDLLATEEVNRNIKNLDRLAKKIDYLKKYQMMAIQNAPSISQMEDSAATLLQKFHDVKTMTLPLWKRQIRMYIDGQELRKSAALAASIDDANNALIKTNSDIISGNSIETAKLNQRSLIDDSTIEHVHQNLISTLGEIAQINKTGQETRIKSASRMDEMKKLYTSIARGQSLTLTEN